MCGLDPRTNMCLALLYAILIVLSVQPAWLLAELGLLLLLVVVLRRGWDYLRWLRLVGAMTLFWFAIAWWSFDPVTATTTSLRLLSLSSVFFLFFQITAPEDLGNALVKLGLPYAFAFVLSTALLFVPVISRKAQNIIDAQRSRGIPLEPGWAAVRHYPALLAPLLVQSFQLADELAEALEARGFARAGRTFWRDYRMQARDWLVLTGAGIAFAILIFLW